MDYIPETVVIIRWPHSQRIMEHPEARVIDDASYPGSYIIPSAIWEQWKNTYYKADNNSLDQEICFDCNNKCSIVNLSYCKKCQQIVCDNCYIISNNQTICLTCERFYK